jgi:membrane-associated phospholipid phosphatase
MTDKAVMEKKLASSTCARAPERQRCLAGGIRQALFLLALTFSSLGLYLLVLKWRGPDAVLITHTTWDDWFPFGPEWVWVYLVPYLIGPALFVFLSPQTFRWFVPRGLLIVGVTLVIFILCPTQTARRPSAAFLGDSLTGLLYHQMVEVDEPPANAAPSLHVSLTCLLAMALIRDFPRWWPVWFAGIAMVWLSTLMTRQHHLIDVATGALLAFLVAVCWPAGSLAKPQAADRN